ncbi:GNAT family N-acetyltransferase [Nocardioides daeguensis]|uniref:GNAT family N-acetyltransferase n=1 Tax=Nocardioides daeguensis TaxID=908359 RepID=A0ABP6V740_9ACTN|nr:GNAT family N-acetyltransferase [Nocardioides daeguensis]MBV6726250.1 GNAT family N-acetyltransferase [Nocardioides daeguensis]MCR1772093.1 GNAT family N-acetyltransferase [Nocardioides daeguensis]
MTALVPPDVARWQSWAAMIEDFGATAQMHGSGHWHLEGDPVPTEAGCAAFVAMTELTSAGDLDGTRVSSTYFWITDGDGGPDDDVVGFLNLRHRLNDWLLEQGGHIGYSVRPSARRRGHASRALALGVREAGRLGIERVLVTCDTDNDASRRTIEAGGGVLEDERAGKLRFWIATAG